MFRLDQWLHICAMQCMWGLGEDIDKRQWRVIWSTENMLVTPVGCLTFGGRALSQVSKKWHFQTCVCVLVQHSRVSSEHLQFSLRTVTLFGGVFSDLGSHRKPLLGTFWRDAWVKADVWQEAGDVWWCRSQEVLTLHGPAYPCKTLSGN